MLIDSHCHLHMLDLTEYQNNLSLLMDKTHQEGISHLLTVAVDAESSELTVKLSEQFPQVYASVGIHPSESIDHPIPWERLEQLAQHPKVIAIGETGLDYYYNHSGLDQQRDVFRQHIRLALKVNKPLIIHSRNAPDDTIQILREEAEIYAQQGNYCHSPKRLKGIMHCFTESWQMAEKAMELGFYISFSGIITFKNAVAVQEVVKQVPLEHLLIETDAPYLAPVPYRGKTNQPHYVKFVAEKIAELKQISFEEVSEHTSRNFCKLFNLSYNINKK